MPPGTKMCGSCGAALGVTDERSNTRGIGVQHAPHKERARLTIIRGDGIDGEAFALASDHHHVGRENCPILFPDDAFVSPIHADFAFENGRLVVHDLSANGVYLRVVEPVRLLPEQEFMVGEQILTASSAPTVTDEPTADGTYYFASLRRPAVLRVAERLRGGVTGRVVHTANKTLSLGREGNDWNFPEDPYISGHHAELRVERGGIWLHDLHSRNGSFVRIENAQPLVTGDYLFIGQQLIRVEVFA